MLYEELEGSSISINLTIVFKTFLELDEGGQMSQLEFNDFIIQVCDAEQSAFIAEVLATKPTGCIIMDNKKIIFKNGILYGIRASNTHTQICKVTSDNFDQVYKLVAQPELKTRYDHIVKLRKQVSDLQTTLATTTFRIMIADNKRFNGLKKRNKQIEQVKRAIKRTERTKIK